MNYKNSQETNYDVLIWDKSIQIMKDITSLMELMKEQKCKKLNINNLKVETIDKNLFAEPKGGRLIPVTKWNNYYDYPSVNGFRHLIFHESTNGFDKVVRRIGRRVLIKEDEFFKWVEGQKNN